MIVRVRSLCVGRMVAAAIAGASATGCATVPTAPGPPPSEASAEARARLNARVFDRVWSLVDRRYYDPGVHGLDWPRVRADWRPRAAAAVDERALYATLSAMLQPLNDDHAYVQSPAEVRREAEGATARPLFGLRIVRRGEVWEVDDVVPGTPADEAGVEIGWRVLTADGRPYETGAVRRDGEAVALTFLDPVGAERSLSVAPRLAEPPAERRPWRRVGAAYVIAFDSFDPGTGAWLGAQLAAVPYGAPVVVDLRDNIGGRIVEVERALGCFLPAGRPVAEMRRRGGSTETARVLSGCPRPAEGPVAVLVGRRSRSGAEMFAAALQEAGRARVVGGRTAGVLLSSLQHPLPDGGRLSLSEQDFVTAAGNRIERFGLPPDVDAPATQADRRAGRDPALDAAVDLLASNPQPARVRGGVRETHP